MSRSISARLRFEILKRDNFRCQYCGAAAPLVQLEIEHIIPYSAGGPTRPENLLAACQRCNAGKAAIPLESAGVDRAALIARAEASAKAEWQEARDRELNNMFSEMAFVLGVDDLLEPERLIAWKCWDRFGVDIVLSAFDTNRDTPWAPGRQVFENLEKYCEDYVDDVTSPPATVNQIGRA